MKFTVISGGSTTPELIDWFARLGDAFAVTEPSAWSSWTSRRTPLG